MGKCSCTQCAHCKGKLGDDGVYAINRDPWAMVSLSSHTPYMSSSLMDDDQIPTKKSSAWSVYSPDQGVAWAPRASHIYQEEDESDDNGSDGKLNKDDEDDDVFINTSMNRTKSFGSMSSVISFLNRKGSRKNSLRKRSSSKSSQKHDDSFIDDKTGSVDLNRNRTDSTGKDAHNITLQDDRISVKRSNNNIHSLKNNTSYASKDSLDFSATLGDLSTFSILGGEVERDNHITEYLPGKELQQFLNLHDLGDLFMKRDNLHVGKLRIKDSSGAYLVCIGSLKLNPSSYSASVKPVSIFVHRGINSDEDKMNMLKNLMKTRKLKHPHIQGVLGVCTEGSPALRDGVEVLVATPRTHFHVTLHRLLLWAKENNPQLLTFMCAVTFAVQICHGCRYLGKQGIAHDNLRASTVLLDSRCKVKLSGIEEFSVVKHYSPVRWHARECLMDEPPSFHSTIWSFGVVLWEMASYGDLPYSTMKTTQVINMVLNGQRLNRPAGCPIPLYKMMSLCWHADPQHRPTFGMMLTLLDAYRKTLPQSKPPELLFPDRDDFVEDAYVYPDIPPPEESNIDEYIEDDYI